MSGILKSRFNQDTESWSLTKLGIFVSLNGFGNEVPSELKRMCHSGYHVVLLTRDEIEEDLSSDITLLNWLERQISKTEVEVQRNSFSAIQSCFTL